MYPVQLALLAAEALVVALVVLGLFRSRAAIGRSPLYVVLGGLLYIAAASPLRVEVAPGWMLQPATTVVFAAVLAAVLLVYVTHEPRRTRALVWALVLGNASLTVLGIVLGQHSRIPGAEVPVALGAAPLAREVALAIGRAPALYALFVALLMTYEFVSRFTTVLFVRMAAALAAAGAVSAAVFSLLARFDRPDVLRLVAAEATGSVAAALLFATLVTAYLTWAEPLTSTTTGTGDVSDVLQEMTYRQLYEQARSRMTRDALTGVHNRGYFDESFGRAVAYAERYGEDLSVVIADADHFKTINDRHSHLMGDQVLKHFAGTLVECARASDVICRYGGDEFVAILPNANLASAQAFAERFRRRLNNRALAPDADLGALQLTSTIGIASLREDRAIGSPDDLLRLADNRLYVGKRAGRNRVVWQDLPISSTQ